MGKIFVLTVFYVMIATLFGCTHKKRVYASECDKDVHFKNISMAHLLDSARFYNKQFVEISGKYIEGKNISALVNDSLFVGRKNSSSLWVNFTQDCPLFLAGTQQGLFSSEDGSFEKLNNRRVTIRGRVEANSKGYSATINEVSYIVLY